MSHHISALLDTIFCSVVSAPENNYTRLSYTSERTIEIYFSTGAHSQRMSFKDSSDKKKRVFTAEELNPKMDFDVKTEAIAEAEIGRLNEEAIKRKKAAVAAKKTEEEEAVKERTEGKH